MATAYHKNGPQRKGVARGKRVRTHVAPAATGSEGVATTAVSIPKMDFALDAARRGLSVFLLNTGTDDPLIPNWREVATTDPEQIRGCWALCEDANVGVSAENLLTLRITERCSPASVGELASLFQKHDAPKGLRTQREIPGRRIEILMHFSLPAGVTVGAKSDVFFEGIDVVSNTDFVIGPGSVLDGYTCRFVDDKSL
jgi:Bifunctional DNA primase/polymerase, N-terminal